MVYSWALFVTGVLVLLISLFLICVDIANGIGAFPFHLCVVAFGVILLIGAFERPEPTLNDVAEKKARILETQTITDKDTVRTYKIVWCEEQK